MRFVIWPILFILLCALATPSGAQSLSSAYMKIDIERDCKHRPGVAEEDYGDWRCKGYGGVAMWLGAGDQRMFVSFGPKAKNEPAAEETLPAFNDFYKGVIEWRLAGGKPFAAIMRWNYKMASERDKRATSGRVLVVTRLPPGAVCHIGYVDARANPDANVLARQLADTKAREFQCGKDKRVVVGKITLGDEFVRP